MRIRRFVNFVFALVLPAALLLGVATGGVGCKHFDAPSSAYLQADEATFDAVAPEYVGYVDRDSAITPDQKTRRHTTVETWRLRIDRAKAQQPATAPSP